MLDAFGGYEAHQELEEKTEYKTFTYCWDQSKFNPISNELTCYIHFEFKDGSSIKKAFEYNWRLWSLPEIRECLLEVTSSTMSSEANNLKMLKVTMSIRGKWHL